MGRDEGFSTTNGNRQTPLILPTTSRDDFTPLAFSGPASHVRHNETLIYFFSGCLFHFSRIVSKNNCLIEVDHKHFLLPILDVCCLSFIEIIDFLISFYFLL